MDVTRVVELRVHGVSGTPPEDLLDRALVRQVGGDKVAGFYRPRLNAELEDVPIGSADSVRGAPLEGYAWGGLTSGSPSRALWLLLLPFTLINIAARLRPAAPADSRRVKLLWYVSRAQAIALTMALTLAFSGVSIDLVAWQCAGPNHPCSKASPAWLIGLVVNRSPGVRLVVGAVLPLLVLGALSLLSGRTINRYEAVGERIDANHVNDTDPELASAWMWRGEFLVRRLRHLHLQAGSAVMLSAVAWAIDGTWRYVPLLAAAYVVAAALVLLGVRPFTGRAENQPWMLAIVWFNWAVVAGAGISSAVLLGTSRIGVVAGYGGTGGLPHYAVTALWLFVAQLLMLATTAVLVLVMRPRRSGHTPLDSPRPASFGLGTVIVAIFGVFLAAIFSAGIYLYSAGWLYTGSLVPSFNQISQIAYQFKIPTAISYAALGFALSLFAGLIMTVVLGAWIGRSWWRITPQRRPTIGSAFTDDYPGRPPTARRSRAIMRAFYRARLVDVSGTLLFVLMLPGVAITLVLTAMLVLRPFSGHVTHATDTISGAVTDGWLPSTGIFSAASLQGVGAYLVVGTLLAVVSLGAAAYRVPKTRRAVGILWDLGSFWPRACHPLAAPCYAERSVPELINRIEYHLTAEDAPLPGIRDRADVPLAREGMDQPELPADLYPRGALILAGHSQGTVISAAALLRVAHTDRTRKPDDQMLERIAFLSFGCVLRRLYSRFFPAYLSTPVLLGLGERLGVESSSSVGPVRWTNLWRHSDLLGGPIASGPIKTGPDAGGALSRADHKLIDPVYAPRPPDVVNPPTRGHSEYWKVIQFQQSVGRLAATLPEHQLIDTDDIAPDLPDPAPAPDRTPSDAGGNGNGRPVAQTPQSGRSGTAASPPVATLTPRT